MRVRKLVVSLFLLGLSIAEASPVDCDPSRWEPHITEAASRFQLPALWIRAVLRAESAGCDQSDGQPTTSSAGAMGLMQLMPQTWNEYRQKIELGDNAYDPRDNILAGAAYLRSLFDRYGWPAAAAAYHAGPKRYEDSRNGAQPLPRTTIEYLARVERLTTQTDRESTPAQPTDGRQTNPLFVDLRHKGRHEIQTQEPTPDVQNP